MSRPISGEWIEKTGLIGNMIIGTEEVKAALEEHQKWCDEGMDEALPRKKSPRADLHGFYKRSSRVPRL